MTGKLRCPMGPGTFVDALPHGGLVELWGVGQLAPSVLQLQLIYSMHMAQMSDICMFVH